MRLLNHLGYTNIDHFHGGMHEWQQAGLPLERAQAAVSPPRPVAASGAIVPARPGERGHSFVDLFERRSTADLVGLWFGTIVTCAFVYWLLSAVSMGGLREGGRTLGGGLHGLLTALYFSFVTATSVGFGDVVPLGAVRALAIFEAVVGLLIFGAVVSKLVSRRQEHIVTEIHRIAFEDRLERVQTDLHSVLMEMQTIAQQ